MKCECCGQELPFEKKRVALVVGHKESSQGAVGSFKRPFGNPLPRVGLCANGAISEYLFNKSLAEKVAGEDCAFADIFIIERDSYSTLPSKINAANPDFIVSLHCNAFNGKASGTETLYYHKSPKGKSLAYLINSAVVSALELPNRGIKPKSSEDRGGYLLRYTHAPCVILESFFIDNPNDLDVGINSFSVLAKTFLECINLIAKKRSDVWG